VKPRNGRLESRIQDGIAVHRSNLLKEGRVEELVAPNVDAVARTQQQVIDLPPSPVAQFERQFPMARLGARDRHPEPNRDVLEPWHEPAGSRGANTPLRDPVLDVPGKSAKRRLGGKRRGHYQSGPMSVGA